MQVVYSALLSATTNERLNIVGSVGSTARLHTLFRRSERESPSVRANLYLLPVPLYLISYALALPN